jgi:hypothetical protein
MLRKAWGPQFSTALHNFEIIFLLDNVIMLIEIILKEHPVFFRLTILGEPFTEITARYQGIPQNIFDPGLLQAVNRFTEMFPSGKSSGLSAGPMLGFQLGKMMSRNQFEHLMKDCVTMGHGPESPVCLIGYAKPILTDSKAYLFLILSAVSLVLCVSR